MTTQKRWKHVENKIIGFLIVTLILGIVLHLFVIKSSSKDKEAKVIIEDSVGIVFIGDSRTVGLNSAVDLVHKKDTFVIAKSGMGYNWFMKDGYEHLKYIRKNNDYDKWIYVFNLGVNDLTNVDKYIALYKELSKDATVYYLSINPTDDSVGGIQCSDIMAFNKKITSEDIEYIDSYDYLDKVSGYSFDKRNDGMHYDEETYEKLYEFIMMSIEVRKFVDKNDGRYSAYFYLYNYR